MKPFLIFLFLLPLVLTCQWTSRSGSNRFDGSYKVASVRGTGGEFPYENPMLVINRFEPGEPNIYITGIGYTGCGINIFKIAFDNDEKIYEIYDTSTDTDKEAVFIKFDKKFIQDLTIYDFIDLLKSKSKLYVRHINDCGDNDYTFNLVGSTRSIEYVIEKHYYDEMRELDIKQRQDKEKRNIIVQEVREEMRIRDSIAKVENARMMAEKERVELEQFPKSLKLKFQNADEVELLKFKTEGTVQVDFCFQVFSSGRVYPKKNTSSLFASDEYVVFNRIIDNCLMIKSLSRSGKVTSTFYMSLEELSKVTNSPKLSIIKEHWDKLVELSKNQ